MDSFTEILDSGQREKTCLILPTLSYAVHWWQLFANAAHDREQLSVTKTAIVFRQSHSILRLWVPYEREPTMPFDIKKWHSGFKFLSLFYYPKEVKQIASF